MYEDKFSKWERWKHRNILHDINYPGVYAIAYSEKHSAYKAFSWLNNIIYIGMTNSKLGLAGRLMQFNSTIYGKTGHVGGKRVRFKYPNYGELIEKLYVSICPFKCNVASNKPDDLRIMGDITKFE